jgi:hypothetical protein
MNIKDILSASDVEIDVRANDKASSLTDREARRDRPAGIGDFLREPDGQA